MCLCYRCGAKLQFGEGLKLKLLTPEDIKNLKPVELAALRNAVEAVLLWALTRPEILHEVPTAGLGANLGR